MKKLFVLLLVLLMIIPTNIVLAENEMHEMKLDTEVSFNTKADGTVWLSLNITEDDAYRLNLDSESGLSITLYNKEGYEIKFLGNPKWNELSEKYIYNRTIFFHKGSYLIGVTSSHNTVTVTGKLTKVNSDYIKDIEPNEDISTAITVSLNKQVNGVLNGFKELASYKDENDWYKLYLDTPGEYQLYCESTIECYVSLYKESDLSRSFLSYGAEQNFLKKKFIIEDKIDIDKQGQYYIKVSVPYDPAVYQDDSETSIITNAGYGYYKFSINSDSYQAPAQLPPQTTATPVGVKISWENPNNSSYRIYRAEAGGTPKAISGVVYGNSFVDVNVESDKKYYYMVVPERDGNISAIDESISAEAVTETIVQPENTGVKNFILMQIGSPNMTVGDKVLEIDPGRGTVPVIQNGRTLVPIRAIVEAMGGTVEWNESEQKVTLNAGGHNVQMTLGQKEFIVDGTKKEMDIAPSTINDRTMLPIRFVTENVGCRIEWIGSTQEIIIVF